MDKKPPVVISIGYGRHFFTEGNGERERMKICAKETKEFHMIVFTRHDDGLSAQTVNEKLFLHPTNSLSRFTMLYDAYCLGARIIQAHKGNRIIVTTQDPFEAGIVGYLLKQRFGIHLTIQEHADAFSLDYWRKESIGNRVRFLVGKFLIQKADVVRVVSTRILETIKKINPKVMITKLPVAVDPTLFSTKMFHSRQNNREEFWFLTVARFVPQKNLSLLVRAFAAAYHQNPKLRLRIVGTGLEQARVEAEIKKLFPAVEVPILMEAWSQNVPQLMCDSDAYVLSSNYEGWARVLVEAVLSELPVVTTDVGCVGEVVQHEKHGLVVPVNDRRALADALLLLATDTELYTTIKHYVARIDKTKIPGVGMQTYGIEWVKTLG